MKTMLVIVNNDTYIKILGIIILVGIFACLISIIVADIKSYNKLLDKYIYYRYDKYDKAKELLEKAITDMETLYEANKDEGCYGIEFKWRYSEDVEKLFEDDNIDK